MTTTVENWHSLSVTDVINKLGSDVDKGLSAKDVIERQEEFGKNKLQEEKPLSAAKILLEQFKSSLIYILIIAGFIVLLFQKYTDAIVIFGAVFLNAFVGFFQENKASKALRGLKEIVKQEARVIREGDEKIIDSQELVPGDIFELAAGDKIPVDGRLVTAYNLKINESALTGEWLAAEKRIDALSQKTPLADRENVV